MKGYENDTKLAHLLSRIRICTDVVRTFAPQFCRVFLLRMVFEAPFLRKLGYGWDRKRSHILRTLYFVCGRKWDF